MVYCVCICNDQCIMTPFAHNPIRSYRTAFQHHLQCLAEGFTASLDFAVESVVADVGPSFVVGYQKAGLQDDVIALREDWIAVGQEIQSAMDKIGQEICM